MAKRNSRSPKTKADLKRHFVKRWSHSQIKTKNAKLLHNCHLFDLTFSTFHFHDDVDSKYKAFSTIMFMSSIDILKNIQ